MVSIIVRKIGFSLHKCFASSWRLRSSGALPSCKLKFLIQEGVFGVIVLESGDLVMHKCFASSWRLRSSGALLSCKFLIQEGVFGVIVLESGDLVIH